MSKDSTSRSCKNIEEYVSFPVNTILQKMKLSEISGDWETEL